ncbi:tRNA (adenosine(37)-N6)-threonylcarbamoyltransferase complex dimerization subunit type 1 TsaB [Kiloniella sp. EL199]|uniref:tRNA (adenosine(37)-N6)-threonylcarbamoyltransferase complex dimerization subunit type 1 TsaB n=1 Tax=Kiloniella sp. EL199 TaxID=2107581 RepID=UPI000EA0C7A6|nr:tRNA (adenosine(37)-N6)-threonylcarbamoyltransferase complex dimerization subunit type 1 TsaB [Kiloniella sp. EL199]
MRADSSLLLGLDTAGSSCSVAIMDKGQVLASRLETMRRGQSERLLPIVQDLLEETGRDLMDMDGFAVTTGPGGFTGVRIGLAAAQGFALACNKPLVGVSNFEVLARGVPADEKIADTQIVVVIDAKRADLFVQSFDSSLVPLTEPFAVLPENLNGKLPDGNLLLVGDGVDQVAEDLKAAGRSVRSSKASDNDDAGNLLLCALEQELFDREAQSVEPLYLRAPDVSLPKDKTTF